jgi:hypothetical protein
VSHISTAPLQTSVGAETADDEVWVDVAVWRVDVVISGVDVVICCGTDVMEVGEGFGAVEGVFVRFEEVCIEARIDVPGAEELLLFSVLDARNEESDDVIAAPVAGDPEVDIRELLISKVSNTADL